MPRTARAYHLLPVRHVRRRKPPLAGGYCFFLSSVTFEERFHVAHVLREHGVRCQGGVSPLLPEPRNHFVAVHQDADFHLAAVLIRQTLDQD